MHDTYIHPQVGHGGHIGNDRPARSASAARGSSVSVPATVPAVDKRQGLLAADNLNRIVILVAQLASQVRAIPTERRDSSERPTLALFLLNFD